MSTRTTASVPDEDRRRLVPTVLGPIDAGVASVALLFWVMSLRPSLLPRPPATQGLVSAVCLLVGYGLAGLALLVFRAQRLSTNSLTFLAAWTVSR